MTPQEYEQIVSQIVGAIVEVAEGTICYGRSSARGAAATDRSRERTTPAHLTPPQLNRRTNKAGYSSECQPMLPEHPAQRWRQSTLVQPRQRLLSRNGANMQQRCYRANEDFRLTRRT
jgi:hypothetical protein